MIILTQNKFIMKTFKIDIIRSDIDKHLSNITAYTGVKRCTGASIEDIDRISTAEEDTVLLDRYWVNAANVLAEQVKGFIASLSVSGEALSVELHLSDSFDDSLFPTVSEGMASFMTAYMAKSWFAIACPDKADEWSRESSRLLAEISRSLYHRRRPSRK